MFCLFSMFIVSLLLLHVMCVMLIMFHGVAVYIDSQRFKVSWLSNLEMLPFYRTLNTTHYIVDGIQ